MKDIFGNGESSIRMGEGGTSIERRNDEKIGSDPDSSGKVFAHV